MRSIRWVWVAAAAASTIGHLAALSLLATPLRQAPHSPAVMMPNGIGIDKILPPEQFDHPYGGKLAEQIVQTVDELRMVCGSSTASLACAQYVNAHYCIVTRLPDAQIESVAPLAVVMRHEIGHCNGWGRGHIGARPWFRAAIGVELTEQHQDKPDKLTVP